MEREFVIAEMLRNSDKWNFDLCRELCEIAGMDEQFDNADGESFEDVVFRAADRLNVSVV